jgi:hypothetical protein
MRLQNIPINHMGLKLSLLIINELKLKKQKNNKKPSKKLSIKLKCGECSIKTVISALKMLPK